MNILSAIFPKAKKITSEAIATEIQRAESDLAATHDKLARVFDGLAVMSDEQHADAEDKATTLRRYGERLQARIDALRAEHEAAIAAEAEAAKVAAAVAHQKRIEAARHAVEIEGAELLRAYESAAAQIAETLARVAEINAEAQECRVPDVDHVHRKHPDREATEHREQRLCWVHHDGSFTEAHKNASGEYVQPMRTFDRTHGYDPAPELKMHEVVVSRGSFRPGRFEDALASVRLPPAFAGGQWAWPRS